MSQYLHAWPVHGAIFIIYKQKKKENKNSFSHYIDYTFAEGLLLGMQVLSADKFSSNSI